MSDEENDNFNPGDHKKLLDDINSLVKTQRIKKVCRSEPSNKKSEFDLVKTHYSEDEDEGDQKKERKQVSITNLSKVIGKNVKQKQIGKQLKVAFQSDKILKKPLERVHADRLQRTVAYDVTTNKLGRWDAIVTQHKMADQIVFPLNTERVKIIDKSGSKEDYRYKTEFRKQLEEIRPKEVKKDESDTEEGKLSLLEMMEKRKEMRRIKMREAYKINKERKQNKIKSKTYHKLKKREKLKEKLKEFEELRATDPEAALKELEKIEKQRVEERARLRHKNTGTWAKNLQVRAKYDKNVKQDLEAQLALGRELTQKQNLEESSDSEEEMEAKLKDENNPWLKEQSEEKNELDDLFSGYKKFWEERNSNVKKLKEHKEIVQKLVNSKKELANGHKEEQENLKKKEKKLKKKSQEVKKIEKKSTDNPGWSEEDDSNEESKFLNDVFEKAEEKLKKKVEKKYKNLEKNVEAKEKQKKSKKSKIGKNMKNSEYLDFKRGPSLKDIDDGLLEGRADEMMEMEEAEAKNLLQEIDERSKKPKDIDPDSFLTVKSKHLITALPKTEEVDELFQDEEDVTQLNKMSLAEAFEDDDIVNDFAEEVEANENGKKEEILTLPGWGSWGGHGVKEKIQRLPEKPQVKKKDRIIINEDISEKAKKHLVSSLPFPFKTVKDFESTIRTPVGRDFVPETAHKLLTMPEVVTKAGTIIEPMNEDALISSSKTSFSFKLSDKKAKEKKAVSLKTAVPAKKEGKKFGKNKKNKIPGTKFDKKQNGKAPKKFGGKKFVKKN